jgi:hypothetical protein
VAFDGHKDDALLCLDERSGLFFDVSAIEAAVDVLKDALSY